jgi:hypothetical protein
MWKRTLTVALMAAALALSAGCKSTGSGPTEPDPPDKTQPPPAS